MSPPDHGPASIRRRRLDDNLAAFRGLLERARTCLCEGRYERAALFAEVAAYHATWNHNGWFASPELEEILRSIARRTMPVIDVAGAQPGAGVERVLHVASMVSGLAGLQHLIRRWIDIDNGRRHSVVVSQKAGEPMPESLLGAVERSGGTVRCVGDAPDILGRAARIAALAAGADLVVLHLQTEDVAPLIGLGGPGRRPPVVLVNHADHAFWAGASIVDRVVNLRHSGLRLCHDRRGIDADRLLLLPTPLDPVARSLSCAEAKARLGIPSDAVVLLSVARAPKFVPQDGGSFPGSHLELLREHPQCFLLAVGPPHDAEWEALGRGVAGRMRAYGPRADTGLFFQAADVYLDSFPMPSVTSLLEAGSYGLPLLTRCAGGPDVAVWGSDAPGIDRHMIRVSRSTDYIARLAELVESPALRDRLGQATREHIEAAHVGKNWAAALERFYAAVKTPPEVAGPRSARCEREHGELDLLTPELLSHGLTLEQLLYRHRAQLPLDPFMARHLSKHPKWLLWTIAAALVAQLKPASPRS